jgi:hypothetical protein
MTVALTVVEDALRLAVLSAGSNVRVIFFRPNASRPELPYTSIEYLTESEVINDWDEFDQINEVNQILGYREEQFTINCYGSNAFEQARKIQGKITVQTIRDTIRETVSASILSVGGVRNITPLVDSGYENRATFDINMLVNVEDGSTTDDTGFFTTVETIEWTNQPA